MRIFIAARYSHDSKSGIPALCSAVREAAYDDYCFVRDVPAIPDQKALWERALSDIKQSDAMLIDLSDQPSGGRIVEAGIAYGLHIPLIITVLKDVAYKPFFDGIAALVIRYDSMDDITRALRSWDITSYYLRK